MSELFSYLVDVMAWAYQIAGFLILALIPIRMLVKAVSGSSKGSFL